MSSDNDMTKRQSIPTVGDVPSHHPGCACADCGDVAVIPADEQPGDDELAEAGLACAIDDLDVSARIYGRAPTFEHSYDVRESALHYVAALAHKLGATLPHDLMLKLEKAVRS